jgi:hypothetical protein
MNLTYELLEKLLLDNNNMKTMSIGNILDCIDIFDCYDKKNINNKKLKKILCEISNKNNLISNDLLKEFEIKYNTRTNIMFQNNMNCIKIENINGNNNLQSTFSIGIGELLNSLYDCVDTKIPKHNGQIMLILLNQINKILEIKPEQLVNFFSESNESDEFIILSCLLNDFTWIKFQISNKLDNLEFGDDYLKKIKLSHEQINLIIVENIYMINLRIYNMIYEDLKTIDIDKPIYFVTATLEDYFTDLKKWLSKEHFNNLLETLNIRILVSDIFDKNSNSRNIFEQFIQENYIK